MQFPSWPQDAVPKVARRDSAVSFEEFNVETQRVARIKNTQHRPWILGAVKDGSALSPRGC